MYRKASVVTGTRNFHLLLWIIGGFLFCSGSVGLTHDDSVHTNVPIEHCQEKADLSQKSLQTNAKQTFLRWHDVTEMRDIHYTKWRMEERTHSYTTKKNVSYAERRSKKYTIMIPENRDEDCAVRNNKILSRKCAARLIRHKFLFRKNLKNSTR